MMSESIYEVISAQGAVVNTIVLADPGAWTPPAGCSVRLYVAPPPEESSGDPPAPILTQLAFLRRFTPEERIAIRASNDLVVQDFLHLLGLAQDIRLDDADTVAGVGYLESLGLLAAGRAAVVLGFGVRP